MCGQTTLSFAAIFSSFLLNDICFHKVGELFYDLGDGRATESHAARHSVHAPQPETHVATTLQNL
jgi:hypothetical protein